MLYWIQDQQFRAVYKVSKYSDLSERMRFGRMILISPANDYGRTKAKQETNWKIAT